MKNIKDILVWGKDFLKNKGIDSPLLDTEIILSKVLSREKSYLYAYPEYIIPEEKLKIIKDMIYRRGKRIPLSYILNEKEFYGNIFYVEKGVFTPRPETEILVEEVIKIINKDYSDKKVNLYEIGLGTGAISVTVALKVPNILITGCDICEKALWVTKKNLIRYNLQNKVKIIRTMDFIGIKRDRFDIIVSNPPYLSFDDYKNAEREVRVEPKKALMAKEKGLYLIKKIIRESKNYLKSGKGYVILEIGDEQSDYLMMYAKKYNYACSVICDYSGKERILKLSSL